MNTHPDVMWELVRDRQARLREEAEQQNRLTRLLRSGALAGEPVAPAGGRRRWFSRPARRADARTLAAWAPGAAE